MELDKKKNKTLFWVLILTVIIDLIFLSIFVFGETQQSSTINNTIQEVMNLTFEETNNPELYDFSFNIGDRVIGVNINESSNLILDYNAILFNNLILNQYNYQKIQDLQNITDSLQSQINMICNNNPLLVC